MKKWLMILLFWPVVVPADFKNAATKFVTSEAKLAGDMAVKSAISALGEEMQADEVLLNACIGGSTALTSPPEYLLEVIGNKMGWQFNPARYSNNVRRHFFRCLCTHPEAVALSFTTENPWPIAVECGYSLGVGFVTEIGHFATDLRDSYHRTIGAMYYYWRAKEKEKVEEEEANDIAAIVETLDESPEPQPEVFEVVRPEPVEVVEEIEPDVTGTGSLGLEQAGYLSEMQEDSDDNDDDW